MDWVSSVKVVGGPVDSMELALVERLLSEMEERSSGTVGHKAIIYS